MLDANDFEPLLDEAPDALDDDPWLASLGVPESDESVGEVLARLLSVIPDAFVAARLSSIDPASLSPSDAVTYLQVHGRVMAWWSYVQQRALVAAGSGHPQVEELLALDPRPDRHEERRIRIQDACREEIAAAMRWSPASAQDRLDAARLLVRPLAVTGQALADGSISIAHAIEVVRAASLLPGGPAVIHGEASEEETAAFAASCEALQRRVLPVLRRGTAAAARACAKRAILAIDAEGARRRREQARCTRDVWVSDSDDGTSLLMGRVPTEHAHACLAAIDAAARASQSAPEGSDTVGERRSQALVAMLLGGAGDVSRGIALRVHLDVTMTLDALLGLTDEPAELVSAGGGPATVVSAETVRELLADPEVDVSLRRLVSDPISGHLLDVGRTSYAIGDRLRAYVAARDRVCRFPGCRRRAARCQIDHAVAWDDGGETSRANVGALCVRHHQLKTHAGWEITGSAVDGTCAWVSPQGRTYDHGPPPY